MNKRPNKMFISYFLLAVSIIAAYQIITNIDVFVSILGRLFNVMRPFLVGFVIAYVLNMPYEFFRKLFNKSKYRFLQKKSKPLSIVIVYLLFIFVIYLAIRIIVPSVYTSILDFAREFPVYYNNLIELLESFDVLDFLEENGLSVRLEDLIQLDFLNISTIESVSSSVISALMGLSSFLLSTFIAFISSIYMLAEKERFAEFFTKAMKIVFKGSVFKVVYAYLKDTNKFFRQYIYCQSIDALILGTIVTLEMSIIGVQYAPMLGVMLGLANYIPIFGSLFGSIIAVIIILITDGTSKALITGIVLLITQQIDGNFISPKLLGASFKISPLLVIISITIGGYIAGPFGMIVAIPVIAVIKNLLYDILYVLEKRRLQKGGTANEEKY